MQNYPPAKYMKIFNKVAKTQKEKTLVRNAAYFYDNITNTLNDNTQVNCQCLCQHSDTQYIPMLWLKIASVLLSFYL